MPAPQRKGVRFRLSLSLALGLIAANSTSLAESTTSASVEDIGGGEKRVTLSQSVEPSFHIEPIVHRFEARRGTTIPFRFEIKSTGKAMNVTVMPVRLRQEVTGIILHDEQGEAPDEMKFLSPTEFKLEPGESTFLVGEVTVPLAKSNYLSYGVLVRDNGYVSGKTPDPTDPTRITAGVRFVTQYVLRVDIETGVKDVSQMNQLAFEHGSVINELGMPVAKTFLINPTDFAFECSVRGTIESATTSRPKPFRLSLPSRVNLEGEERYLVRIMPRSRVQVTAPVEELLFPGEQSLKVEVTNGRRGLVDQTFAVNVGQGDFPALEVQQAYLDHELSVHPAQIAVGDAAGVSRSNTLRFTNNSVHSKNIVAELVDLAGNPVDDVQLSSDSFDVRPGRTKTVRLSISSRNDADVAKYGDIRLRVRTGDDREIVESIPMAMIFGTPATPNLEVGELVSVEKDGFTSFAMTVTNLGEGYVPVHADLQIGDATGNSLDLADGFGRWLRPGETRELAFVPPKMIAAGQYQIVLNLVTTPDQEPVQKTLVIELDPKTADEQVAEPKAATVTNSPI
ncbi:hypothetical protein [Rubripirellula reticaptiva]|uniref:Large cysteine-rich periplasmic protein OmcB n=1 Tax=Rubripirellula reticaptiva TaxID=2528013 RepID=A0A5C6EKZ0_9BACT|nr:hypothetical protein [Rubripirellula reticaptiva]TWU48251.1 hypothetical protein Poly59_50970 [Rubripirellula reticaptiva]